jgi:hypothetical protein
MTSRPKHVASLSDKIAGLKFMQRAKATQSKDQPGPSSSSSLVALSEPQDDPQEDINDEHWSLPIPKTHHMKQSGSSTSLLSHEPGWNAWLIEAEDEVPASEAALAPAWSSRRSFGTWVKKKKKKVPRSNDSKKSGGSEDDEESYKDSSDEESNASDNEYLKNKGFIKPGQKQAMSDLSSLKSISDKPSIKKERTSSSGEKRNDKRREQDKGIKRSNKDSLSGFPDGNDKPSKKNKKPKTR